MFRFSAKRRIRWLLYAEKGGWGVGKATVKFAKLFQHHDWVWLMIAKRRDEQMNEEERHNMITTITRNDLRYYLQFFSPSWKYCRFFSDSFANQKWTTTDFSEYFCIFGLFYKSLQRKPRRKRKVANECLRCESSTIEKTSSKLNTYNKCVEVKD